MASCSREREAVAQRSALEYRAPAACPNAAEFEARVERTLQGPLDTFERRGRFQVTIAPAPQGYELTVVSELRGERGTRVLSGTDCNSVADAGALSIALALSSAPQALPRTTAPARAPSAPALAAVRGSSVTADESLEPARNPIALQLFGDYGTLPRVAPGARVTVGRAGRRWSGRLGFGMLRPVAQWVDGRTGPVGGRFWFGAARAEGCRRAAGDAWTSLDACLVFEAGAVTGAGLGVDVSKTDTLVWLAPGGRVVGGVPLVRNRAQVLLGVEALVPVLTKRFTVENGSTELYTPSRVVARVDVGVGWQF